MIRRPPLSSLLLTFLAVLLAACSGSDSGTAPATPTSVRVSPSSVTLEALGATAQVTAQVLDQQGQAMPDVSVSWSSSASPVVRVSASGTITAVGNGSATITASAGAVSGSVAVSVRQRVVELSLTPSSATLSGAGETLQLVASGRDAGGSIVQNPDLSWSSSDSEVATVDASGLVRALAPGLTTVRATTDGVAASADVEVVEPLASVSLVGPSRVKVGEAYAYEVEQRLADGSLVDRPVTWSVVPFGLAEIDQNGRLLPLAPGNITVQVTIDGIVWESTNGVRSYDWRALQSSGNRFLVVEAHRLITNKFGTSEYPELVFACSADGSFLAWVDTEHFVTASGLVGYRFGESQATTFETWLEFDGFSALGHPGPTNLATKNFARSVAEERRFLIAFNEFRGDAHAVDFRVTGLDALLPELLNACPSNALRSNGVPAVALRALAGGASEAKSASLETLRAQRAELDVPLMVAPATLGRTLEAAVDAEVLPMTRRR